MFGDSDRPVTMSDLLKLKYLECCIKEALRLYPSVPMLGRTLSEDVIIREYQFIFSVRFIVNKYAFHSSTPVTQYPQSILTEFCYLLYQIITIGRLK